VGGPLPVAAQVILDDCSGECSLRHAPVAVLGEESGPGYVGRVGRGGIVQRSDGVFAVRDVEDQDRVKFFDENGRYLRSFGRQGDGPGEFQIASIVLLLEGDSVEVYDLGNRRRTVIAPDFTLGRISHGPDLLAPTIIRLRDGTRVMNGALYTPQGLGLPLHHVDVEGQVLASFGADPPIQDLAARGAVRRFLTTNDSESVWSGALPRYRMEEWTVGGGRMRVLEREVDWFTPHDGSRLAADGSPRPRFQALHEDKEGLLWTVVWVPAPRWEEGLRESDGVGALPGLVVTDYSKVYDSVVEVIDPEAGRVVRSQRFDIAFIGFIGDGLLFADHVPDPTTFQIGVWEVRFDPESDSAESTTSDRRQRPDGRDPPGRGSELARVGDGLVRFSRGQGS
jgi:hypothetical protein